MEAPGDVGIRCARPRPRRRRRPEFKGNVLFVETHDFVRKAEDSPNPGHGHHEFGNAETYFLVGDALGKGDDQAAHAAGEGASGRAPQAHVAHGPRQSKAGRSASMTGCSSAPRRSGWGRGLRFLEAKLDDIKAVVPADKLKKLQAVTIVLDLNARQARPDAVPPRAPAG